MVLVDVNVLIYAHRGEAYEHERYRVWLHALVNGDQAYGISDIVLSAFVRIVTNPRAFALPSSIETAMAFAEGVRHQPNCLQVVPGPRHWSIFTELCRAVRARGNLVPDAFLAALAIEHGCTWVTADHDFSRFPGLDWRHPLA